MKYKYFAIWTGVFDKVGNYAAYSKSLLDLNLKKCFYELNRLNRYIQSVEDSQIRMILTVEICQSISVSKNSF